MFVNVNSFEDVESKTFIVPLSVEWVIELSIPTTSVVLPGASASVPRRPPEAHSGQMGFGGRPPEAKRRCTGRRTTARSRLRSCCSPKALRWTPRTTSARASIREACARHRVSPTWGASKKLLGSDDHKWHVNELMNDHNAICHIDINFVSIFIDIVSLKVICWKQDVLKLVECVCKLFVNIFCV